VDSDELLERVDVRQVPHPGLWRIGREPDPLRHSRLDPAASPGPAARAGNRWDSPDYGVLYLASDLEGCFGETLARFRPQPDLAALVRDDWVGERMAPGQLPRDWRDRRTAVHIGVEPGWLFLDVESVKTRAFLQEELALGLAALGVHELDVPAIRGQDRRVTQLISEWTFNFVTDDGAGDGGAPFAGIAYASRVSTDWQCWAVFEGTSFTVKRAEPILETMPALLKVCDTYKIRVH